MRILEETLALQALGSTVTICTYRSGNDVPGLNIRRALGLPWRDGVQVGSSPYRVYFDALLSLRTLLASVRVRPHVIHAHLHEGALIGGVLSKLWRVPLIFDYQGSLTSEMIDHGFMGLSREGGLYRPLLALERKINGLADVVLTSSHNAASVLVSDFGYPEAKVMPLPDCVNTERFFPRWQVREDDKAALLARLGIPFNRKLIVYLGLLAQYQGSGHLLLALAELLKTRGDVHLLMMGFPGQARYQQMARELGVAEHVTFTGRVPYGEAPAYLALGDVAVSPKISETEGNGKLLNYMAVGLPTVTFDTPVSHEILGDLGVYARIGDWESLAVSLDYLLYGDVLAADEIGRALRERAVERFSWQEAGRRLVSIYESLANGRKHEATVDSMANGLHSL
ncbi:MAG: glycosyltransferase family 4 protein [Dehalococcoidales bacterium]|nr:glycosyltransferase family 4 protein [Dehalococcoidales bacterium]